MVRLKQLQISQKPLSFSISLNSTMVRLKLVVMFDNALVLRFQSQFHYGSIKTKIGEIKNELEVESQFHYGSIKTN